MGNSLFVAGGKYWLGWVQTSHAIRGWREIEDRVLILLYYIDPNFPEPARLWPWRLS